MSRFFDSNQDHPRLTVYFPDANLSDAPDIQCINVAHRYFSLPSEIRRLLAFAKTRIYELKLPNNRPFQVRGFYNRFYFLAVSFLRILNINA